MQTRRKRPGIEWRREVRGSVVSRMARKVSREMLVTPSKSTALRRCRIN